MSEWNEVTKLLLLNFVARNDPRDFGIYCYVFFTSACSVHPQETIHAHDLDAFSSNISKQNLIYVRLLQMCLVVHCFN